MPSAIEPISRIEERRRAISEAFHTFHQPLTSLHCGLEIALLKPRSDEEYRKRIQDALASADMIFELNKALRELVDAEDPGERFGTVAFAPLFSQLLEEVRSVADTVGVNVSAGECPSVYICADPMKLLRMLGNLLVVRVNGLEPGGEVKISMAVEAGNLRLAISTKGSAKPVPEPLTVALKAQNIRLDAARNYIETLGGEMRDDELMLPIS